MDRRALYADAYVIGAIILDVAAHFTNLIDWNVWVAITPFAYGTPLYELSGTLYWFVAGVLFAYARYRQYGDLCA